MLFFLFERKIKAKVRHEIYSHSKINNKPDEKQKIKKSEHKVGRSSGWGGSKGIMHTYTLQTYIPSLRMGIL